MDDLKRSIASIKAGRAALNWSQKQLAEKAKVSLVTIARFEAEMAIPQGKTLFRLKQALENAGVYIADNSPAGGFSIVVSKSALK